MDNEFSWLNMCYLTVKWFVNLMSLYYWFLGGECKTNFSVIFTWIMSSNFLTHLWKRNKFKKVIKSTLDFGFKWQIIYCYAYILQYSIAGKKFGHVWKTKVQHKHDITKVSSNLCCCSYQTTIVKIGKKN